MQRFVPLIAALISLVMNGCRFRNCARVVDHHCEDVLEGNDVAPCASNDDCMNPDVCDTAAGQCVQCLLSQTAACVGITPICGGDHTCRPCIGHDDCARSRACLPEGACAADVDVAYVDATSSDNPQCSQSMPCRHIAPALATGQRYVKVRGRIDEGVIIEDGRVVGLLAEPGAVLTRSTSGGPVLLIRGDGTSVAIHGLAIADAISASAIGIVMPSGSAPSLTLTRATVSNNPGGGISVSGGTLTILQSVIAHNRGGGITIFQNGRFDLVNNVFFANGSLTSPTGGLTIAASFTSRNRVEFNSFYANVAQDGVGAAIDCVSGGLIARNNILFENGTLSSPAQVGGGCEHQYSIALPGPLPSGIGNQAADPQFVRPDGGDFHLLPGSPAIGAADPASILTGATARDFDGSARVSPASVGAFQP